MAENRLDVILSARAEGLTRGLEEARRQVADFADASSRAVQVAAAEEAQAVAESAAAQQRSTAEAAEARQQAAAAALKAARDEETAGVEAARAAAAERRSVAESEAVAVRQARANLAEARKQLAGAETADEKAAARAAIQAAKEELEARRQTAAANVQASRETAKAAQDTAQQRRQAANEAADAEWAAASESREALRGLRGAEEEAGRAAQQAAALREQAARDVAAAEQAVADDIRRARDSVAEQARQHINEEVEQAEKRKKAQQESLSAVKGQAQDLALGLGAVAAGGALLTKTWLDAASKMEQFRATLTAVTHDVGTADAMLRNMVQFAASTPFEIPSIVQAGVTIQALGLEIEKILPLAGDLAAVFGRDVPDAALALGKAMAGSQDGITMLADSWGITRQKMMEFGAATDGTGGILVRTREQVDQLRKALMSIVKTEFGGAMAAQSQTLAGAFSNLSDAIGRLKTAFGEQLAPAVTSAVRSVTGLIETVERIDKVLGGTLSAVIAWGTVMTTGIVGVTGVLAGLGVVVVTVGEKFVTANKAITELVGAGRLYTLGVQAAAVAGPLALLVAGLIAMTVAMKAAEAVSDTYVDAYLAQDQAVEAAARAQVKLAAAHRGDWANKSAEQLVHLGVSTRDIALATTALNDRIFETGQRTDLTTEKKRALITALQLEKADLQNASMALAEYLKQAARAPAVIEAMTTAVQHATLRHELHAGTLGTVLLRQQDLAAAYRAASDAAEAAYKADPSHENLKKRDEALTTWLQALNAAAKTEADIQQGIQQREEELSNSRVQFAQQWAARDQQLLEARRSNLAVTRQDEEKALSSALWGIEVERKAKLDALERWRAANQAALAIDENMRRAHDNKLASINMEADAKVEAARARARQNLAQDAAARLAIQQRAADMEVQMADQAIKALQERRAKSEAVEKAMAAAIQREHEAKLRSIQLERDHALATEENQTKRQQISQLAESKIQQLEQQTAEKRRRNHDEEIARITALNRLKQDSANLAIQQQELIIEALKREAAQGRATAEQIRLAEKQLYEMKIANIQQALQRALEAAQVEKDAAQQGLMIQNARVQAEIDLTKAALDYQSVLGAENAVLQQTLDTTKAIADARRDAASVSLAGPGTSPLMDPAGAFKGGARIGGNIQIGTDLGKEVFSGDPRSRGGGPPVGSGPLMETGTRPTTSVPTVTTIGGMGASPGGGLAPISPVVSRDTPTPGISQTPLSNTTVRPGALESTHRPTFQTGGATEGGIEPDAMLAIVHRRETILNREQAETVQRGLQGAAEQPPAGGGTVHLHEDTIRALARAFADAAKAPVVNVNAPRGAASDAMEEYQARRWGYFQS